MTRRSLVSLLLLLLCGVGFTACGETRDANTSRTASASASGTKPSTVAVQTASTAAAPTSSPDEKVPAARKAPSRPGIDDAYDGDDGSSPKTEAKDDEEIEIYGRPATPAEYRSTVAFVKSYFAAAAAGDGTEACGLLLPGLAKDIGGSYEKPGEPAYLHGKTCPEVMTKLFKHRHKLMVAAAAGLEVTDVRVTAKTAFVLVAFKGVREPRYLGIERYGDTWKLEALIDSPYP